MCGPGCKFLGSFMLIPISISGVNKAPQLGLMRLYHREGSSEVGGRPRMDDSLSFQQRRFKKNQDKNLTVFGCSGSTYCLHSGTEPPEIAK